MEGVGFPSRKKVRITVNGKEYSALENIPLSVFLLSEGIKFVSTSTKYYRPRSIVGLDTFNRTTLVRVNGVPNVNPNTQVCSDGLNVDLSVRKKPILLRLSESFLDAGFQHKKLIRHPFIWRVVERFIFRYANYHEEPNEEEVKPANVEPIESIKTDVVVVGGGIAGLNAAIEARKKGLRVVLFDDQPKLGGRSRFDNSTPLGFDKPLSEQVSIMAKEAEDIGVEIHINTVFLGFWEDGATAYKINEPGGGKLFLVDAMIYILATGELDLPCVYENNDLPGSITASTALRLVNEYGISLGKKVVQLGLTSYSARVAKQLAKKGIKVIILIKEEEIPKEYKEISDMDGIEIITGVKAVKAEGRNRVERVIINTTHGEKRVDADYVVFGAMENPNFKLPGQAGVEIAYFNDLGFIPIHNRYMETKIENILVTGSVTGTKHEYLRMLEGRIAGLTAAIKLGVEVREEREEVLEYYTEMLSKLGFLAKKEKVYRRFEGDKGIEDLVGDVPTWFSTRYSGKQFICFCEDITVRDLYRTVINVGFDRMELIKRYTGIATGKCQGRLCLINASLITSKITGKSPNSVGLIRQRVPIIPLPYRVLAEG